MRWLQQLGKKPGQVGIEMLASGFGIAVRPSDNQGLQHVAMIQSDPDISPQSQLNEFVQKHGLAKRSCYVVLPADAYQMVLIEAPDVPDNELREAVRWKAKDVLTIPVEQAAIEVFDLPKDGSRSGKRMVYVVAAEMAKIKAWVTMIREAGLELESIEIEEMALRNLSLLESLRASDRGAAIVRLVEGGGGVSFFRDGNLYLSRQFSINYGGGLLDDLPVDTLGLEVQRSLDYYERQMGMAPPSVLYICGENISEDKISVELKRSLTVPVEFMDLKSLLDATESVDEGMLHLCIGAVGGAYRPKPEAVN